MTKRPKPAALPTVAPANRAMWGVAFASQRRTKLLTPALRRAYGDGTPPLNVEAAREALQAAEGIVYALTDAIALAEQAA